ncbi:uncharacterized protein BDR25DRAFT_378525 [Lindgomyces ingoldianus]|uniref:Uncharacterized protein n=1 Tax=Lindgomyces ingoldianus TaxID=673940 RepID=A0ACB6QFW4_9PLEO|nr:uncharacterized protein BDR25DRAFT_378525 [Lindgomyces ingoldianus]KAF2465819.1 hypothetical protein BDR25DRAFT_378525 [Lindgomyces ingoldianus]
MSSKKVHSWHININAGDSAIHLLVNEGTTPKPTILGCVLIDGGKGANEKIKTIKDVIAKIEKDYTLPAGDLNLKFDSIVITHWDVDHWEGVVNLLVDDLSTKLRNDATYKKLTSDSYTLFKKTILKKLDVAFTDATVDTLFAANSAKVKKVSDSLNIVEREACDLIYPLSPNLAIPCRYLRYTSTFPTVPVLQNTPPAFKVGPGDVLTRFYVPYMTTKQKLGLIGPHQRENADDDDDDSKPKVKRRKKTPADEDDMAVDLGPLENDYTLLKTTLRVNVDNSYKESEPNTVAIRVPLTHNLGFEWPYINNKGKPGFTKQREKVWRFNFVAKLYDSAEQYLGAELFRKGNFADKSKAKMLQNPADLIGPKGWGMDVDDGPGMFVVAGDQYVIGDTPLAGAPTLLSVKRVVTPINTASGDTKLTFRPRLKVVDSTLKKGQRYDPRGAKDSKAKNSASIVCLILAPTGNKTPKDSFKILHFLGGDALWDVEGALVTWMKNQLNGEDWPCLSTAIKLSHHGGKESTEVHLLEQMAPQFMLCSIGEKGEYFHPHAEVLAFIHAAIAALRTSDIEKEKVKQGGKADHGEDFEFQENLKALYALSGLTSNIYTDFRKRFNKDRAATLKEKGLKEEQKGTWKTAMKTESDTRRKAMGGIIRQRWEYISPNPAKEKFKAWKLILGIGEQSKPRHLAWIQDNNYFAIPVPNQLTVTVSPPPPPKAPPADSDKMAVVLAASSSAVVPATGTTTKSVLIPPRIAVWARIAEVPEDPEADESPFPLAPSPDAMVVEPPKGKRVLVRNANIPAANAQTLIVPIPSIPEAASPSRFYVYSTIYSHVTAGNPNEVVLDVGNPLNNFLSALDPGFWVTDTLLNSNNTVLSLDAHWAQGVTSTLLNINSVTMKGLVVNKVAQVTEIGSTITSGNKTLSFSTSATYDAMVGGTKQHREFSDAFYPPYNLLVLGLSSVTQSADFTLGDILRLFGPHWMQDAADVFELPGFDSGLKFVLDASGKSNRNGLFFQADSHYPTWLRLQFNVPKDNLDDFKAKLQTRLDFLGSISLSDACVICRKQSKTERREMPNAQGQIVLDSTSSSISSFVCIQATVTINSLSLRLILEYDSDGSTRLIIRFDTVTEKGKPISAALEWLAKSFDLDGDISDLLPGSENIYVLQVAVNLGSVTPEGHFSIKGASVTFTLEVDCFGAAFFVEATWPSFRLRAFLWTDLRDEIEPKMLPWLEPYMDINPANTSLMSPEGPKLTNFLPDSMQNVRLPPAVDFRIVEAEFESWMDAQQQMNLIFHATLCTKDDPSGGEPALDIDTLSMTATRIATTDPKRMSYEINISTVFYLLPRNFDPTNPNSFAAQISASVDVLDGLWVIKAEADNLQFAALYSLFDSDVSDSVMDILEEFSIPRIQFAFTYGMDKAPNISLTGALRISTFEIDVGYWYNSAESWSFQGQLGFISDKDKITIAHIVREFDTSIADVLDEIEFIKSISIPAINQDATDFDSAPIQFYMTSTSDAVIMWFQVEIDSAVGAFTFLFAQYKPKPKPNAQNQMPATRPSPKRLIRVRLDHLPTLPNIPIVGSIGQPVDSISYVYVQDSEGINPANKSPSAGFTLQEIDAINATLQDRNAIRFRDTKSNLPSANASSTPPATGSSAPPNYVLLHGHHFIVVTNGKVVVDHKFGSSTPSTTPQNKIVSKRVTGGPVVRPAAGPLAPSPQATAEDSGATMGQSKKSFPGIPITINNFGIQVKDKRLYLLIDAKVLLGPIELTLEGFGIGIPLNIPGISFADLAKKEVIELFDIKLTGIGVYFNAPPVMIAGCFFHIDVPEYEAYRGGLAVSILPYTLLAVGSYQHNKLPKDFKSVFVFARLDGPLFTLEFAEISGVSAGFGYNYDLRLPTAGEIMDFPLVHGPESSDDPMKLLSSRKEERSSFVNWTTAKETALFFAIGMKVDAFQVLTVDAAAILAISADDVKIALVGIASASMPPSTGKTKPPEAFIYVELGIVASLDITGGSLLVAAQLTPNSYVLAPDCHLTGGFALCYWFGRNENAGDWVFTVGGYHPAFKKPKYYPDVPRVGISWNLSDVLTVRGESYFAICPKACMGGGRLLATFSAGPIYASFEAWASFLINFKPFFFVADIGINVSVGCNIDFWIVHIHIHAELGASLHLQGPPFGGVAHVHFWVMGFDVYFGDQNNVPDPLSWDKFLPLIKQPGPGSDPNKTAMCVIAIEKGSADEKSSKTNRDTGEKWFVRAGSLQFRVETKFPIEDMDYGDSYVQNKSQDLKPSVPATGAIYGRPMQLKEPYKSHLSVKVVPPGPAIDPKVDDSNPWLVMPLIRSLPKALWAKYDKNEDPTHAGNSIATLLNSENASDATVDHLVGFTFRSPDPKLPSWSFPEFNALAAMQEGVFQDDGDPLDKPVRKNALLGPATGIDERPKLKPTPPSQTTDLPDAKKPDIWVEDKSLVDGGFLDVGPSFDEVEGVWQAVDEEATQLVADAWGDVMGWWGVEVPGSAGSSLSGKKPTYLIGRAETFEVFYLEAPWLTKDGVETNTPVTVGA